MQSLFDQIQLANSIVMPVGPLGARGFRAATTAYKVSLVVPIAGVLADFAAIYFIFSYVASLLTAELIAPWVFVVLMMAIFTAGFTLFPLLLFYFFRAIRLIRPLKVGK